MAEKEKCRYSESYKRFLLSYLKKPALNLGCNGWKMDAVNVDYNKNVLPDRVWDLNKFPYPFKDGSYRTIFMIATLEHLKEPQKAVRECERLLAPGGRLIAVVPAAKSPFYRAKNHLHFFDKRSFGELLSGFDAKVFGYRGDTKDIHPLVGRLVGRFNEYLWFGVAKKR